MSESKEIDLYDLRKAKRQMEAVIPIKRRTIEYIGNILKTIASDFAQQKKLNLNTLIEDLGKQCMKMKKKIRVLKDEVEDLISKLIYELNLKSKNDRSLTKIKNTIVVIKDLKKSIKEAKSEKDFRSAERLKKELVKIRGNSYENIILPLEDLIESSKLRKLERKVEKVDTEKENKKQLRKGQKKLMLDFINFLITYKKLDQICTSKK